MPCGCLHRHDWRRLGGYRNETREWGLARGVASPHIFAAGGLDPIDVSGREAIHHHVQQTPEGYVFKDSAHAGVAQRKQLLHSPTARAKNCAMTGSLTSLGQVPSL